jgi:prepilin-type N-terminal cleavage/methylation domain-containing protein
MIEKYSERKYEGFSLVEMLITIAIIGMVMLISSITLTSLIKVSTVASNKIRARNESEFVLEMVRRTVRNSDPSDVYIFQTEGVRKFNFVDNTMVDDQTKDMGTEYTEVEENEFGNEIHFRPYGYRDWICLGFFRSSEEGFDQDISLEEEDSLVKGYILRTSAEDLAGNHESCFENPEYIMVLNSDYVNIKGFNIAYTLSNDANYIIRFDIKSEPVDWYLKKEDHIKREVFRQGIVSTEGLIW